MKGLDKNFWKFADNFFNGAKNKFENFGTTESITETEIQNTVINKRDFFKKIGFFKRTIIKPYDLGDDISIFCLKVLKHYTRYVTVGSPKTWEKEFRNKDNKIKYKVTIKLEQVNTQNIYKRM